MKQRRNAKNRDDINNDAQQKDDRKRKFSAYAIFKRAGLFAISLFIANILIGYTYINVRDGALNKRSSDLKCNITNRDANSAINRARTLDCKAKLHEVACLLEGQQLTAHSLSRSCPVSDESNRHAYIGCYALTSVSGVVDFNLTQDCTPIVCADKCLHLGFQIAGVYKSVMCRCANLADLHDNTTAEHCRSTVCTGDNGSEYCGGNDHIAVYNSGFGEVLHKSTSYLGVDPSAQVRVLFLLQLNGRASRQVVRLLKLIYRPHHFYFIHVDSRQKYFFEEMLKLQSLFESHGYSNFYVTHKRYTPIWGANSLLTMILNSIGQCLEELKWKEWHFIQNLSENDFPMATIAEYETLLASNIGMSFLKSHGGEASRFTRKQGLDKVFVECEKRMWRVGNRDRLPTGIFFDGGSDWIILSRDMAEYAYSSNDSIVTDLKEFYKYTLLPAESFFHTLAYNSPFCTKVINQNLKFTNWQRKQGCKCQYKKIVDWCGCSPSALRSGDIARIRTNYKKHNLFWTRKVESIIDIEAIERLEMIVLNEPSFYYNTTSFHSFWLNLFNRYSDLETAQNSRLNFMYAIAHLALEAITNNNAQLVHCQVTAINDLHAYSATDASAISSLLDFEALCEDKHIRFEVHQDRVVNPERVNDDNVLSYHNVGALDVNTNFDVKELFYRNYGGELGNDCALTMRVEFHPKGKSLKIKEKNETILAMTRWKNPSGEVIHENFNEWTLQSNQLHIKYTIFEPNDDLAAGVYMVELFIVKNRRAKPIAYIKFPIFHAQYNRSSMTASIKLARSFYRINDWCSIESVQSINNCLESPWSSHYPDPKSNLYDLSYFQ